jgi:uncharacterized protein (UPF0261 family)
MDAFRRRQRPEITVSDVDQHINAPQFARLAAAAMDEMIRSQRR